MSIATIWQILIFCRKSCLLTLSLFQCEKKCILLSVSTILAQANRASLPRFFFWQKHNCLCHQSAVYLTVIVLANTETDPELSNKCLNMSLNMNCNRCNTF